MPLVRLESLTKTFVGRSGGLIHAVNSVSLDVESGETLGVIGESGSGKSTIGRLALGLLAPDSGDVYFDGIAFSHLRARDMRALRSRMQIVFQEPYQSLNPQMSVGQIVEEPLVIHARSLSRKERYRRMLQTLEEVGLGAEHATRFPAALSGGQQQRVGIARAIVTRPQFVVLDEPTSSLDLSVRGQIINLLLELQAQLQLSYMFISHDISTVRHLSHRVAVMYLGRIVEAGPTERVIASPQHPYTQALLSAVLSADPEATPKHFPLRGEIPSPAALPRGCPLYGRCPIQIAKCAEEPVPLHLTGPDHSVACIMVPAWQVARHPVAE
jgi:oligopeptide/dipeptide ABC transporter ATP-binding protein